jgi:hypothetical protein
MTAKRAVALVPLLVAACVAAGCDAGGLAATGGSRAAAMVGNVLTCGRVLDSTGYKGGPLTTDLAIASLTEMQLTAGAASIPRGTSTPAVTNTLDTMAVELMGYSGNRLSDDAQAFAVAEINYNPDGPVEPSYARPLDQAIAALQRDCPDGLRLGRQRRAGL